MPTPAQEKAMARLVRSPANLSQFSAGTVRALRRQCLIEIHDANRPKRYQLTDKGRRVMGVIHRPVA